MSKSNAIMRHVGLSAWLYGPVLGRFPRGRGDDGPNRVIAPLTLNIDDVRDLEQKLRQVFPTLAISVQSGNVIRPVEDTDAVFALPAYDRDQIIFSVRSGGAIDSPYGYVNLRTTHPSSVEVVTPENARALYESVAAMAANAGRHVRSDHIRRGVLGGVFCALGAVYGWACYELASVAAIPLLVLLAVALVPAWLGLRKYLQWRLTNYLSTYNRVRLEVQSRRESEERRYNVRRDRRVAIYTGVVIGPLGALIATLITLWAS